MQVINRKAIAAVLASAALVVPFQAAYAAPDPGDATPNSGSAALTIDAGAATLQGTYILYKIGSYADVVMTPDGNAVQSINVTGDATQNAWAQAAIDAYNAASDTDIQIPDGVDAVGTIARLNDAGYGSGPSLSGVDAARASRQLSGVAAQLADASGKPAAAATKTDAAGEHSVTVEVPEGLYLVVDSAGMPLIVGTTANGKSFAKQTLGTVLVKENTSVDKKLSVDGTTWSDSVSASRGDTIHVRATKVVPNGTHAGGTNVWKLVDTPDGMAYKAGTLKLTVDGTDVSGSVKVSDTAGATVTGDATIKDKSGKALDPDITVPGGGFVLDAAGLLTTYAGKTLTIDYDAVVTTGRNVDTSSNTLESDTINEVDGKGVKDTTKDTPTVTYGHFTLTKTSQADTSLRLNGAGFKIQKGGKWLRFDRATGQWSDAAGEDSATVFMTGDTNGDGKVDGSDDASAPGTVTVSGLGAGDYLVKEVVAPSGYRTESFSLPTFTATVAADGNVTFKGKGLPNLTVDNKNGQVTVEDIQSLLQLPNTGGAYTAIAYVTAAMAVAAMAVGVARVATRRRDSEAR